MIWLCSWLCFLFINIRFHSDSSLKKKKKKKKKSCAQDFRGVVGSFSYFIFQSSKRHILTASRKIHLGLHQACVFHRFISVHINIYIIYVYYITHKYITKKPRWEQNILLTEKVYAVSYLLFFLFTSHKQFIFHRNKNKSTKFHRLVFSLIWKKRKKKKRNLLWATGFLSIQIFVLFFPYPCFPPVHSDSLLSTNLSDLCWLR